MRQLRSTAGLSTARANGGEIFRMDMPVSEPVASGTTGSENRELSDDAPLPRWRRPLLLAAPILVIVAALYYYLSGGRYESTDNAQLQAGIVSVAPAISGRVKSIEVRENQVVRRGQVLFTIRADSFSAAVAEAEAELANARAEIGSRQASYQQSLSDIRSAEARLAFAQGEAARQKALLAEGIASRSQYEAAVTEARTAGDAIAAAKARSESLRAALSGNVAAPAETQPDVRRAAALLDKAKISLGDTVVRASQDGVVTKVNQLQVGNYVTAGRPVFMLTGTRFWVVANFKEDQLRYMRAGQPAVITLDAFPDHQIRGRIASFSPGTGNSFSILPAENATGNWVKVVQRVPVEISIDQAPKGLALAAGLSAQVKVDTGHKRSLFGSSDNEAGSEAGK